MTLAQILSYAASIAGLFISYILGRIQSAHTYRNDQLQKRYDMFYVPYIRKLYKCCNWLIPFHNLSQTEKNEYFNIIFDNIQYIGHIAQKLIPEIYAAHYGMQDFENGDKDASHMPRQYERVMCLFTEAVLFESKELSKSLQLPELSKALAPKFSRSRNTRSKASQEAS